MFEQLTTYFSYLRINSLVLKMRWNANSIDKNFNQNATLLSRKTIQFLNLNQHFGNAADQVA